MRVQKSVYYMTDRELRIYKRQLRRRRQLQRRIVTMLATICVIAFCAVSYHGIRSLASSGEDQLKFKYYTQVTVAYGETCGICPMITSIMMNIRIRKNILQKYRVLIIWQKKTRSEPDRH